MRSSEWSVRAVPVPNTSRIARLYDRVQLADAFEIRLPPHASADAEQLARFVFSLQAPWVTALMSIRDRLVALFGIKTARELKRAPKGSGRISIFKIYDRWPDEVLFGEDDRHLDFRVSVLRQVRDEPTGRTSYLTLSTVVHCHNRLGRTYIFLIAPFHRLVVRSFLSRAARFGWPGPLAA